MDGKIRIYKWYLILSIIYSSVAILTGIISFISNLFLPVFLLIWLLIVVIWFIFSIAMFIVILVKKIEKIALLLPGLYIFDGIFSLGIILIAGVISLAGGIELEAIEPILAILGLIFPVITLVIAIKLLMRE